MKDKMNLHEMREFQFNDQEIFVKNTFCYEHTQEEDLRDLKNEEMSIKLRCYLITTVLFANR